MFIAHKNDIIFGNFEPLLQFENKKIWVNQDPPFLVSNICPHQSSLISLKEGSGNNRTCPYHAWSFTIDGIPISSGNIKYCRNDKILKKDPLFNVEGLILTKNFNFKNLLKGLNIENLELIEKRVDKVLAAPEKIIDLFLDVDHIPIIHKGVYDQLGIQNIPENLNWDFYDWGSIQIVRDKGHILFLWITIYPNTMIEYQKGSMFVTVTMEKFYGSDVIVYKYRDNNLKELWKLNELVWETAWSQDKSQAEIITELPNKNLEISKVHFRNWLNNYELPSIDNRQS